MLYPRKIHLRSHASLDSAVRWGGGEESTAYFCLSVLLYHSVVVDIVCFWPLLFAIVSVCRAVKNPT